MEIAVEIVLIALAALLGNALLNQLPILREFPGKTALLIRMILWLSVKAHSRSP